MEALKVFLDDSVALGKLVENYTLHFHKDFQGGTSPGKYVVDIVQEWPQYSPPPSVK